MLNNFEGLELLNFVILSEKRTKLLCLLKDSPKLLEEIKESLEVSSSGIIPQLRKMEKRELLETREGKKYGLTGVGWVIAKFFNRFNGALKVLEMNRVFWEEHDVSKIPEEFLLRLNELEEYKVFEINASDVDRPHKKYLEELLKANRVRGVSPILHPDYPQSILQLAHRGADISIIMSEKILSKIKDKHMSELKEGLGYDNLRFLVCRKEVGIAFTVTDHFLSMRLPLKDGTYDLYKNIISYDKSALKWGKDLFKHFEEHSEPIE